MPVYRTGPYQFESTEKAAKLFALAELGNIYSRIMNPTTDVLEKRMSLLEGAPELGGLGVASGTNAAFYSIINLAQAGDNIVSARNLYGGTYTQFKDILPTLGITVKFVDSNSPKAFAEAADEKTRAFFTETVSNPALDVADIKAISDEAHKLGLPLIVDDTFTTPYLCRPFDHGADIICHSLTKWTGGHGTAIGGIVIDKGTFDWSTGKHPLFTEPDTSYGGLRWGIDLPEMLAPLAYILRMRTVPLRNLGGCMSPDNAWMALQGIETLPMRMEKHCARRRPFPSPSTRPVTRRPRRRRERHEGGDAPVEASQDRVGPLPRPVARPDAPAPEDVFEGQGRPPRRHRPQGRPRGRREDDQLPEIVLARGQRRRCEVAGHPPGVDDALAAERRGAGFVTVWKSICELGYQHRIAGRPTFDFHTDRDGPAAGARAPVRGHRAHRRHHQGPEPGAGADRVDKLPPSTPTTQSTTFAWHAGPLENKNSKTYLFSVVAGVHPERDDAPYQLRREEVGELRGKRCNAGREVAAFVVCDAAGVDDALQVRSDVHPVTTV